MDDRYQHQSRIVKAYRWLRWKPYYIALACYRVAWWAVSGCKPVDVDPESEWVETRWSTLDMIWGLTMADASIKMNHVFTLEEVWPEFSEPNPPRAEE